MCSMCVFYLASLTSDDADIGWDSVAPFDLHQIPHHQLVGVDLIFLSITDHNSLLSEIGRQGETREWQTWWGTPFFCTFLLWATYLWHQILEAGDDVGTLELLVVSKASSNHNDSNQSDGQVELKSESCNHKKNGTIGMADSNRAFPAPLLVILLTSSKQVRFPLLSSIPKAMKQMTAATHIRHCSPPASCLANFTYSGVPFGGFSSLGPSLSKICWAKVEVMPCGWRTKNPD